MKPIQVSLVANCVIVFPLSYLLLVHKPKRMERVYGPDTDARRILASLYLAIGVVSVRALMESDEPTAMAMAAPLLGLQIVYKMLTVVTVGLTSPVVITNVGVTALHLYTLHSIGFW